jgi:hypothetical protein
MIEEGLDQRLVMKARTEGYGITRLGLPRGRRRYRLKDERAGITSSDAGMDADQLQKVVDGDEAEARAQGLPVRRHDGA